MSSTHHIWWDLMLYYKNQVAMYNAAVWVVLATKLPRLTDRLPTYPPTHTPAPNPTPLSSFSFKLNTIFPPTPGSSKQSLSFMFLPTKTTYAIQFSATCHTHCQSQLQWFDIHLSLSLSQSQEPPPPKKLIHQEWYDIKIFNQVMEGSFLSSFLLLCNSVQMAKNEAESFSMAVFRKWH